MRISNCRLAFNLLQAAGLAQALADAGLDADSRRVVDYCDRLSAATHRPIRDVLDLTIREAIALRIKVEDISKASPISQQPGGVIPGCIDTQKPPKRSRGADLGSPYST